MMEPLVVGETKAISSPASLAGEGEGEGTFSGWRGAGCGNAFDKVEPSPQSSPAGNAGEGFTLPSALPEGFTVANVKPRPNRPLEPMAGGSWLLDSKLSSARRGSAARRSVLGAPFVTDSERE